jgi:SSS family solute:Na+ symporter
MTLSALDWTLMLVYLAFVLGIGLTLRRYEDKHRLLQAGRALPAWVCGLAFLSANLGAQEIIGMAASGAKAASRRAISTGSAPSRRWCSSPFS